MEGLCLTALMVVSCVVAVGCHAGGAPKGETQPMEVPSPADLRTPGIPKGQHFEITVGPSGADVVGKTGRAIQIAIDALAYRGGGTVRVLPGTYVLQDAVRLRSGIRLVGHREKTILRRDRFVWSKLAVDADTSQREVTPEDASRFRPGMGICLRDNRRGWAFASLPYTITHIEDGVLHLNDHLTTERYAENDGKVVNYFPLILGVMADNVVVDGFTVDAQVEDGGVLAGMWSAVVYLWRCKHSTLRNLIVKNGRGDGICFAKSSLYTTVEDCETSHNEFHGIHAGSYSTHAVVRRCDIHHNGSDGLYVCWGISHSRFEDNQIHHNGSRLFRSGISIGHKDTDNLIARNHIHENFKYGVCIRQQTEANGAHRNVFRGNIIENNGSLPGQLAHVKRRLPDWESVGCGVDIRGITKDLTFENNTVRETRSGEARTQHHAIRIGPGVSRVKMTGNVIKGHPDDAIVDESESDDHKLQAP